MQAEGAQAEVEDVDLEQRRGIPRDGDPGSGGGAQRAVAAEPGEGQEQGDEDAEEHRQRGDLERHQAAGEHLRQGVERRAPVEGVVEHQQSSLNQAGSPAGARPPTAASTQPARPAKRTWRPTSPGA